jgi:hypothetical protein
LKTFLTQFRPTILLHAGPTRQVAWWPKRWNNHKNCNFGSVSAQNDLFFSPTERIPALIPAGPTRYEPTSAWHRTRPASCPISLVTTSSCRLRHPSPIHSSPKPLLLPPGGYLPCPAARAHVATRRVQWRCGGRGRDFTLAVTDPGGGDLQSRPRSTPPQRTATRRSSRSSSGSTRGRASHRPRACTVHRKVRPQWRQRLRQRQRRRLRVGSTSLSPSRL